MTIERRDPDWQADERTMLNQWLAWHRLTLAVKCDGLSPERLRQRSVPPSTMSLLGLVRHMGEVEKNWFQRVLMQEDAPPRFYDNEHPDGDFDDVDTADVDDAFTYWREACDRAREIERSFGSLDDCGHHKRLDVDVSLRWVLVHMIEEYARHNGHADLLRERIDGTTGD
jgi:uncharacterized damage-inducible protein DinB